MFLFTERPGKRAQFRFVPCCLVISLIVSIALTILANLLISPLAQWPSS
jgi:hypothetical protein